MNRPLASIILLLAPAPLFAQEQSEGQPVAAETAESEASAIPAPETITLPDMTSDDAKIIKNGWKHFYFHKAGVSYEQAYADISECYRYLPVPYSQGLLPRFAPWEETPSRERFKPTISPYGPVGEVIGAIVSGPLERRARQSRMRRCLEPRGYVRYPISRKSWKILIDNYSAASIATQAKAATGKAPNVEVVTR